MILTVQKEVNVEILQVYLGCICQTFYDREIEFGKKKFNSIKEWREGYPQIFNYYDGQWTIMLYINPDTGKVINWPKKCPFDFNNYKIADTGRYVAHTPFGAFAYQGYVPDFLGAGGYGDYLTFEIDENSHIVDWKFDQEIFDEFMSNVDNLK
jgi:hypothetical protein